MLQDEKINVLLQLLYMILWMTTVSDDIHVKSDGIIRLHKSLNQRKELDKLYR